MVLRMGRWFSPVLLESSPTKQPACRRGKETGGPDHTRRWRRSGLTDGEAMWITMLGVLFVALDLIMQLQSGMGQELNILISELCY